MINQYLAQVKLKRTCVAYFNSIFIVPNVKVEKMHMVDCHWPIFFCKKILYTSIEHVKYIINCTLLGYFAVTLYVPTIFATSGKKVLDPNGPYINTFQTILRNVCLSIISEFFCCLWSVAHLQPTPAYVEARNIH